MSIDQYIDQRHFEAAVPGDRLAEARAEEYNTNGFAVLRNHVPLAVLDGIRADVDALVAENHRSQKGIDSKSPAIAGFMNSEYVRGTAEAFNGPSELLQSFAFCKLPGERRTKHWHQDGVYWDMSDSRVTNVFIPLTPATEANGCVWCIPGTHLLGRIYHEAATDEFGLQNLACDISSFRDPVPCLVEPGDALVVHTLTVHASFFNETDRPRINLGFHWRHRDTETRTVTPYRKRQAEALGADPARPVAAA